MPITTSTGTNNNMKSITLLLLAAVMAFILQIQTATAQTANNNGMILPKTKNPFLSTTLSTKITSVSEDDSGFNSERKSTFSETLTNFLHKIFHDQQVYDVNIISVNIFDDHVLKDGHVVVVARNNNNNRHDPEKNSKNGNDDDDDAQHTLSFTTVVSAEYTNEEDIDSIANDNFRKMLVHVCDKFRDHLIQFMKDTGDPYFMNVESVVLGEFERGHYGDNSGVGQGQQQQQSVRNSANNEAKVMGMSGDTLNTASIIAIVVGSIVFGVLAIASFRFYRKEKELKEMRWRTKEIVTLSSSKSPESPLSINSPNVHNTASHPMVEDDYSFDPTVIIGNGNSNGYNCSVPLYTDHRVHSINNNALNSINPPPATGNGYNGSVPPFTDYRDDPIHNTPSINEEEVDHSSFWPESSPPTLPPASTLFPAPGAITTEKAILSYTEELNTLPRKTIFAPPGKIGVAIDVYNGQPVVHKVRKNSPVEKMLMPNDIIVAIDDEDASCLSAADVTSLMVKRMDRVRKITFVRREGAKIE